MWSYSTLSNSRPFRIWSSQIWLSCFQLSQIFDLFKFVFFKFDLLKFNLLKYVFGLLKFDLSYSTFQIRPFKFDLSNSTILIRPFLFDHSYSTFLIRPFLFDLSYSTFQIRPIIFNLSQIFDLLKDSTLSKCLYKICSGLGKELIRMIMKVKTSKRKSFPPKFSNSSFNF